MRQSFARRHDCCRYVRRTIECAVTRLSSFGIERQRPAGNRASPIIGILQAGGRQPDGRDSATGTTEESPGSTG